MGSVFLMDELDLLVTKKQTVIYNFFDWPRSPSSPLIVVAIANTMDLPERMFTHKINSRIGTKRINFNAYNVPDLITIIKSRLGGCLGVMLPEAIEFCARKVAGMSGDARRALDICRRAIEVLEEKQKKAKEPPSQAASTSTSTLRAQTPSKRVTQLASEPPPPTQVTRQLIQAVIQELFMSPAVALIAAASLHQKAFLVSLLKVTRREGVSEVSFGDIARQYLDICNALHITASIGPSKLYSICSQLYAMRSIIVESGKTTNPQQRVKLNVLESDLVLALKNDDKFEKVLEK
jgi:Cdc6-like AAA superfamily ATPase